MKLSLEVYDMLDSYQTKYVAGFTYIEVIGLFKQYNINIEDSIDMLTYQTIQNDIVYFRSSVEKLLIKTLKNEYSKKIKF